MILLDTHVLLWLGERNGGLGDETIARIRDAVNEGCAHVSAISLWEIATLQRRGRVVLDRPLGEWWQAVGANGLRLVPIDADIALDAGSLPSPMHGDPADRTIVATARSRNLLLLTTDRAILRFASAGHLSAGSAEK